MITKTLRQVASDRMKDTQTQIMESLKITEMQHNNHCFENGMKFLASLFGGNEQHPDFIILSQHKSFWNWYKTEWLHAQRDWLKKSKTFTLPQVSIERTLYTQHMEYKCILSKAIDDSFDTWLKLSIKLL